MFDDQTTNVTSKANLELLCDLEIFLGLAYINPLFECVQYLQKFAQTQGIFPLQFCDHIW